MKQYKVTFHEHELLLTDNVVGFAKNVMELLNDIVKMNIPIELVKTIEEIN